jgi:hypothetical protein
MEMVSVWSMSVRSALLLSLFLMGAAARGEETPVPSPKAVDAPKAGDGSPPPHDFLGLGFGVGISLTVDIGSTDRVESATVVNGIVRVTDENNDLPRVMLESHYFFLGKGKFGSLTENQWGLGPFLALQPGSNNIVEAVAFGLMVGLKRPSQSKESTASWNLGLGFVVDPHVQVLGDGIHENQPLPPGETEIRYKQESQWGALIIFSFSF